MSDIQEIVKRLEEAQGPDRELDRLIHFHYVHPWLAEKAVKWVPAAFEPEGEFIWWTAERLAERDKEGYPDCWEQVTGSIDAAMAFAVAKLDDGAIDIEVAHRSVGGKVFGRAEICGPRDDAAASGATPAIALLLALFKALQERGNG